MTKKQKRKSADIISGCILLSAAFAAVRLFGACFGRCERLISAAIYLLPYMTVGFSVLKKAALNILHGQIFDENFLMALATVGAFAIGEYPEAVFVMLFYRIGELFESIAVGKSRKSIASLMDIAPDIATVEKDGVLIYVSPDELKVGDVFTVRAGEKIPLDGTVIGGESSVDTAALTGEAMPREVRVGDRVISGCLNMASVIKVRAERPYSDSTAAKILRLVENAAASKAKSESFISRFARYYTPAVVTAALLVAFVPPIFFGNLGGWVMRALTLLVISCPCALVISVPLSFFAGMGATSANGILVKGSSYLELLSRVELAVFDKTGTLTAGRFSVSKICPSGLTEDELIAIAATADSLSAHPIAQALTAEYKARLGSPPDTQRTRALEELSGKGIRAELDIGTVYVGNARLMSDLGLEVGEVSVQGGTCIQLAVLSGESVNYLGYIVIADSIKAEAKGAIRELRELGVKQTVMLTGDCRGEAERVAAELGIDSFYDSLLPQDKAELMGELSGRRGRGSIIFIGDGINDAPVLSSADVGVAMGALGSAAAIEASDIVIMDDSLRRLPLAVKIAVKTSRIVKQNVILSIAIKLGVLLLSVLGLCPMWAAIVADVGVMVAAVLNAMRALGI